MKTVIVYASYHHKNTLKIARAIGSVLRAEPVVFSEADSRKILEADLTGKEMLYGAFKKDCVFS